MRSIDHFPKFFFLLLVLCTLYSSMSFAGVDYLSTFINDKSEEFVCSPSVLVTNNNDSGAGSLRQALQDVCAGGQITFQSSLSGQTITLTTGALSITQGVSIDGSSLSSALTVSGGNTSRVFEIYAFGEKVVLKGFIVTNGNSTGDGGAILVNGTRNLTLENMTVKSSTAVSGGGIYKSVTQETVRQQNIGSRAPWVDTIFLNQTMIKSNIALYGGGIYFEEGLLLMSGATVTSNSASGSGAAGGGIYFKSGDFTTTNSTVSTNTSAVFGGGMYIETATASCQFSNTAISSNICTNGGGAGIFLNNGTVTMTNHCVMHANDANFVNQHGHGGAIYLLEGTLNTTNSRFSSNTADKWGGAMFLHTGSGSWTSTSDTLLSNSATDFGGGVMVYNGLASMTGTKLESNTSPKRGAGIYIFNPAGQISLTGCTFLTNISNNGPSNDLNYGGGIFIDSATVNVSSCHFQGNKATKNVINAGKGGAIYLFKGTLNVTNSTFQSNETNTTSGLGGAIYVDYGTLNTYSNCKFTSNKAGRSGGGIYVFRSAAKANLRNSIFTSNTAGKLGGGVYMENGTLTQDSCSYITNGVSGLTQPGGGGFNHNNGTSTTTNTYFSGNTAEGGAAVYVRNGNATFTNVLMRGNTASKYGGGIFSELNTSVLTMNNATIYGNTATLGGAGVSNQASTSVTLNNCVIWGNTTPGTANQIGNQATQAIKINFSCYKNGSNDVGGNITPVSCTTLDPKFVNAGSNDFRLQFTSPCLDKGNDTYNSQTYDIRGASILGCRSCTTAEFARKLSKKTGLAGTIDMGAYEFNPSDCTGAPIAPVAFGSTTCYGVKDTIKVTGITGIAGWYDAASGGNWLGGDTLLIIVADSVKASRTYYVQDSTICGASTRTPVILTVNKATATISGTLTACDVVSLTAGGGGAYLWSGGSSTSAFMNTFSTSATYTVTVTDAVNGCSTSTSAVVTVNKASASISGTATACNQVSLTASGGTMYVWSGGSSSAAASNQFVNSDTYTVTVTDNNGCTASSSKVVTVNKVEVGYTGNATGCDVVSLTATGGISYVWSGGLNTSSPANSFLTSGSYSVTVTDNNSCTGSSAITVIVKSGLVASVSSATICPNEDTAPLTATVTPTDTYSYSWSVPQGGSSVGNFATITGTVAGTYTVTVTSSNGCTGTASGMIQVIGEEVSVPVIQTIVQPTCQPLINGKCGLSNLPAGSWTLFVEGSSVSSFSGTGVSFQVENLPAGVYRFWVVSQDGCSSEKTSPFGAVLVTY